MTTDPRYFHVGKQVLREPSEHIADAVTVEIICCALNATLDTADDGAHTVAE